ncbi:aminoacyl-tRNA hydrolase [Candidatus Mycalebacterium sp.]
MAFIIVGLGNPGLRYNRNRHNVGFMAVDKVAEKIGIEISKKDFGGSYGSGFHGDLKLIMFKPETYMNNSGDPVRRIMNFHGIEKTNLVVVHDEVDLPVGHIQVKWGGGSAGHNGIKSVIESVGSEFARLRIGVGKSAIGRETADHVLENFSEEESGAIKDSIEKAADAACEIASEGAESAMNKYNRT